MELCEVEQYLAKEANISLYPGSTQQLSTKESVCPTVTPRRGRGCWLNIVPNTEAASHLTLN